MTPTNTCLSMYLGQNWFNIRSSLSNCALAKPVTDCLGGNSASTWDISSSGCSSEWSITQVDHPDIPIFGRSNDAWHTTSSAILSWLISVKGVKLSSGERWIVGRLEFEIVQPNDVRWRCNMQQDAILTWRHFIVMWQNIFVYFWRKLAGIQIEQ